MNVPCHIAVRNTQWQFAPDAGADFAGRFHGLSPFSVGPALGALLQKVVKAAGEITGTGLTQGSAPSTPPPAAITPHPAGAILLHTNSGAPARRRQRSTGDRAAAPAPEASFLGRRGCLMKSPHNVSPRSHHHHHTTSPLQRWCNAELHCAAAALTQNSTHLS